jgi:hypothetical protein
MMTGGSLSFKAGRVVGSDENHFADLDVLRFNLARPIYNHCP